MRVAIGIALFSLGLSGCFNMPIQSKGKVSTLDETPRLAAPVSATESKSISVYDPNSKVATTIPAPSGALAGSSVTLPAGALAIAAELVVEEAVPLSETSVATSLALNPDIAITPVGSGLIIRPTEDVDLTQPLTIAMPINPTAGLRSWINQTFALNKKFYTVFYKYYVNGELKAGAIPTSELLMSDNGSVLFKGYFGAYWLAEVSAPIEEKIEVKTEEPIINKEKVAVVTNTGVVTETEIVKKAAIPPVQWLSVNLSLDAATRSVNATASIGTGRTLSACKVDLFEKTDATSGINLDAGTNLNIRYTIVKKEAHSLYARFRCLDDQGRQTLSPWSSAVAVSGISTPVVTQPTHDFCSSTPPELRVIVGSNASVPIATRAMTANGSCVYSIDIDAIWGASFAIQTADGKTSCLTSNLQMGDQTATCMATGSSAPQMPLAPGNYTIKLDFKSGAMNPRLSLSLQSCTLGDLYLLTTNDYNGWPSPSAANRMIHMGGCQYQGQAGKSAYSTFYVRIQNQSGSYVCGDGSSLTSHMMKTISCGATNGYYMQSGYSTYVSGYNYVLNLGSNMDVNGLPTSTPYLWVSEFDICTDNRYILGPTSAGNNRHPGVNSFSKQANCMFNYSWIQGPQTFTPFFIGLGEGTQKCGVAPATYPAPSVVLDCSPSAVAIDMQSLVAQNGAWRLEMNTDPVTGKPSNLTLVPLSNICGEAYFAVKGGTSGFRPDIQKALTEVSECIYQYDWTPTASDRSFSFVSGYNAAMRCGRYPGYENPAVGGPATTFMCLMNHMLDTDVAFTPIGVVDGNTYKVNLDFRLGYENPKISIANHSSTSCPDLYVTGLNGLGYADPSNRMTKIGDCNYAYNFKTPDTAVNPYFQIVVPSQGVSCGRDNNIGMDPSLSGNTVPMDCSADPSAWLLSLAPSSYYQILVHYDGSSGSRVSLYSNAPYCYASYNFDGPSALDQNGSYSNSFTQVSQCVEEMLWAPTTSSNSFRLRSDYFGFPSYCGLAGGPQLSLSGTSADVLCSIFNVTQVAPFSVAEGITPAQKYLLRLDRSGSPFDPPKLSASPVGEIFGNTVGTWLAGSSEPHASNTTSYPGARTNAAVWSPPGSPYRYMFGGHGRDNTGTATFLADLWRYDTVNDIWTLLPANDFGITNGSLVTSLGVFDVNNRPSGRTDPFAVFDPSGAGKLWLFGGEGLNSFSQVGMLNDLWVYDLGLNQWALMSGDINAINVQGAMGTPGTPAHSNYPGGRREGMAWIDASGKLYFFGGLGYTDESSPHSGTQGQLNDLWVFDPSTDYASSTWTFLGGDNLLTQPGSNNQPSARQGSVGWTDDNGDFWLFGGFGYTTNTSNGTMGYLSDMWSYHPGNNTWTRRGGPDYVGGWMTSGLRGIASPFAWPGARSQASAWQSPDGKFWLFGGDGQSSLYAGGGNLNDVWTYDPATGFWTWVTATTQSYGTVEAPAPTRNGEFGPQGTPGNYKPGTRAGTQAFPDNYGNVYIFGGTGYGSYSGGTLNDLWYLDF